MKTPRILLTAKFLSALVLISAASHAGNNAGGTSFLSWDREGTVSYLNAVPRSPFPLYLHLRDATDTDELAVTLKWWPFDSLGNCFSPTPAPAGSDTTCGWMVAVPPLGGFDGDSSYTWSTIFPPTTSDRSCVVLWFTGVGCPSMPPSGHFEAIDVRVRDSGGSVDTLPVLRKAQFLGGSYAPSNPLPLATRPSAEEAIQTPPALTGPNPRTQNPVRALSRIHFDLASREHIDLRVYDVSGRLTRRLSSAVFEPGSHFIEWNLRDDVGGRVAPDVYFARLQTLASTRTIRVLIVR